MDQASSNTRLEKAAANAYNLIQGYADKDPHDADDDPQNPWLNPEAMHGTLNMARLELTAAWEELKKQTEQERGMTSSTEATRSPEATGEGEFRALYMDMITDAFADALESMRQQSGGGGDDDDDDGIDVNVLVDCLQSGIDLLDSAEREGFFQSLDDDLEGDDDDNDDAAALPIHEIRRRELGYDVQVSS